MTSQPIDNANRRDIAVLIPCYNEEAAITEVITGFRKALPNSRIYVYDNNSKDGTVEKARAAGAIVRSESRQGKGHVVRRMFADIDAEIYIMVDGDATYDAERAPEMIDALVQQGVDMVVGVREPVDPKLAYRPGHQFGNKVLTGTASLLFGRTFTDMLSGYRAFSRRFVRSFPALSKGFETETELTIHALHLDIPSGEVVTRYYDRPEGSDSKLSTIRDGIRILFMILFLLKEFRPFAFFGAISLALMTAALILAVPLFITFAETGLVPRMPTAVLVTGMMMLASLSFVCGVILDSVSRGRLESKRLTYLALPQVSQEDTSDK